MFNFTISWYLISMQILFYLHFQRHHFEMYLLDGDFEIPTVPYVPMQHQLYVNQLMREDPEGFDERMERYVQGVGGHYFYKNPEPSLIASTSSNEPSITPPYTRKRTCAHFTVPVIKSKYAVISTHRPELFSNSVYQHQSSSSHSTHLSSTASALLQELHKCRQAISMEKSICEQFADLAPACDGHPVLQLEDKVIKMMTHPRCLEGGIYCSFFTLNNVLYVRYLQTGCLEGAFESVLYPQLQELYPEASDILFWEVLNQRDASNASDASPPHKKERVDKREERPDQVYKR